MNKFLALIFTTLAIVSAAHPQTLPLSPSQSRELEWNNYVVPTTNFTRYVSPEKDFLFRAPADWKKDVGTQIFRGPHGSHISVLTQKIPDGYPLVEFVNSMLTTVKDLSGSSSGVGVRRTKIQNVEAREITLEIQNAEGDQIRSTTWICILGPTAITLNLQVPTTHAAEVEPIFKATLQSVMFFSKVSYESFIALKPQSLKTEPGPVSEIQAFTANIDRVGDSRDGPIQKLSAIFASTPDLAIDLLLDKRPLIRRATIAAIVQSKNTVLKPFLWNALEEDALVAEPAAHSLASTPNLTDELLTHSRSGLATEKIARVWLFMTAAQRVDLLQAIFSQRTIRPNVTAVDKPTDSKGAKTEFYVTVTADSAADAAVAPKQVQLGALTLLKTITPDEVKLPLAQLMSFNHDPLTLAALRVALLRREATPVDLLLKLVVASNNEIKLAALQNLGLSASTADIPRLESLLLPGKARQPRNTTQFADEVKLSIRKIQFRDQLATATDPDEVSKRALSDPQLARFAWELRRVQRQPIDLKRDFSVKGLGENILPKNVHRFLAIPTPRDAVQRLYDTINGIQMDSARAQSNLVLMMNSSRQVLANQLGAPAEAASVIDYAGIATDSSVTIADWSNSESPTLVPPQLRTAVICRVTDRERFERLLESETDLANVSFYAALVARGMVGLPALFPASGTRMAGGQQALRAPVRIPDNKYALVHFTLVSNTEIDGTPVRVFSSQKLNSDSHFESTSIYLTYLDNTAVLTSSLEAMRELLLNASLQNDERVLASNQQFKQAVKQDGDVIYFSELDWTSTELTPQSTAAPKTFESGSLKFNNSAWLNTHRLDFEKSEWAKPLQAFNPKDLAAPRTLLPATTVAYFITKVDLPSALLQWSKFLPLSEASLQSALAIDLKTEVIPELGPEVGFALLNPPNLYAPQFNSWLVFVSLKSPRLGDALTRGKLFSKVGPTTDIASVTIDDEIYYITHQSGFLVISNKKEALASLLQPEKLSTTRDYSRAAARINGAVVVFGGYNLEAAIAASRSSEKSLASQQAEIIFSVARAFHSQSFSAVASNNSIEAQSSVLMDRGGRYGVAEFSNLPEGRPISFGTIQPGGVRILDQQRVGNLALRIKGKGAGAIDIIRDDIKSAEQVVEQKAPNELLVKINARRSTPDKKLTLPIADPALAPFLKATSEFTSTDVNVVNRARQIAGKDRDAWSVARKLAAWTFKNLEWRYVASSDASTTLATKEADCSEFSQLFVSMARSLGLPARMVTGMAYGGSSFGGHAWVEVWIGRWIELDPTWGTDFVDATHIRSESSALISSAALNLIEIEVLEAERTPAPFQTSATLLAKELVNAFLTRNRSVIEASLDLPLLIDHLMGAGSWSGMSKAERDRLSAAYSKLVLELTLGYGPDSDDEEGEDAAKLELLRVEEKGDSAEVLCLQQPHNLLIKLKLLRSNGTWHLVEAIQADSVLQMVRETLGPTLKLIESARTGIKAPNQQMSELVRVLFLMESNPTKALEVIERSLATNQASQDMRYLKALALLKTEKSETAFKVLETLSQEGHAPATYKLAEWKYDPEAEDYDDVVALYRRYSKLEPRDPRPHQQLGGIFAGSDKPAEAELEWRKVIELHPAYFAGYENLITSLVLQGRTNEVGPVFSAGEKYQDETDDLFGNVMYSLYYDESKEIEKLAELYPQRMKSSFEGQMALAYFYRDSNKHALTQPLIVTAKKLKPTSAEPYTLASQIFRAQSRWQLALREADSAIALESDGGLGHFQRACALANMRRPNEAIAALQRAIELSQYFSSMIEDEDDLKPLANLPAFKKLLPEEEKKP